MNTCGHEAPRVTDAPRCCECGAYAHNVGEPYKVSPPLPWLLELLVRRQVRRSEHFRPPRLEGHVTRKAGEG